MSKQHDLGVEPPFSAIHPDDDAGSVYVITILVTIYVILSTLVRGFIKWGIYGVDDYLLGIATAIYIAQSGTILYALNHGLSKFNSITTESEWSTSGRLFVTSEILTILTLCLAKCSVILLIHRVFASNTGWKVWVRYGTLGASIIWGFVSMIVVATDCKADTILTNKNLVECPDQVNRWRVITIFDVFTDMFICLLPIALTWSLQMSRKRKSQVVVAFAFRLPVVIFTALHFVRLKRYVTSPEPLYAITPVLFQQQCMLLWSLLSATIPNMKAFIQSFSFEFGLGMGLESTRQKSTDYPLNNLTIGSAGSQQPRKWRKTNNSSRNDIAENMSSALRPDPHQHSVNVHHPVRAGGTPSIGSQGSQDLIIRKVVDWNVRSECNNDRDEVHL